MLFAPPSVSAQQITKRLFYTDGGQMLVSFIFGFALAVMFQRSCRGAACILSKPPKKEDIEGKVFRIGDKCWAYEPEIVPCASKVDS